MYSRGALECIRAISDSGHGELLCTEAAQRLMTTCDILRKCANGFTKLSYREQAAEAHEGCAHALRLVTQELILIEIYVFIHIYVFEYSVCHLQNV